MDSTNSTAAREPPITTILVKSHPAQRLERIVLYDYPHLAFELHSTNDRDPTEWEFRAVATENHEGVPAGTLVPCPPGSTWREYSEHELGSGQTVTWPGLEGPTRKQSTLKVPRDSWMQVHIPGPLDSEGWPKCIYVIRIPPSKAWVIWQARGRICERVLRMRYPLNLYHQTFGTWSG